MSNNNMDAEKVEENESEKVDLIETKAPEILKKSKSDVDDDEEEEEHGILFSDMALEVMDRLKKARENDEYTELPKADWDRHWRTIFDEIRRDVVADKRFPVAITAPPVYELYLRCTDKRDGLGCPCGFDRESLPFVKIEVPREQPHGVTKDLLVAKICEAVHGTEDAPGRIGATDDTMVLDGFDWMDGINYLMYDTIFLYCLGMTSHEFRT